MARLRALVPRMLTPGMLARRVLHLVGWCLPRPRPRVLLYHGVDDSGSPISVSQALFGAHLGFLRQHGYTTWPASAYVRALATKTVLPRRLVVLTFDDGYRNNIDTALPALEKHGFCASVFVVTGNAGAAPRWEERDRVRIAAMMQQVWSNASADRRRQIGDSLHQCLAQPLGSLEEWMAAQARGFEVASHTHGHVFCGHEPEPIVRQEITTAATTLRALGGRGASLLAWPYGDTSPAAKKIAAACGVEAAFVAEWSFARRRDDDLLCLNRVPIDATLGVFGLAFALGRGYEFWILLRALRARLRTGRRRA